MIKKTTYFLLFVFYVIEFNAQHIIVKLTGKDKDCQFGFAGVEITSGTAPYTYLWNTGSTLNKIEGIEAGNYSVKITDGNGKDSIINFIISDGGCIPAPPQLFSPNDDNINDTWQIGNLTSFPDFELYVFNRWGQEVHKQSNTYIPWDGKSKTINLPDASYYYIIYLSKSDKNKFIKGSVSIIR